MPDDCIKRGPREATKNSPINAESPFKRNPGVSLVIVQGGGGASKYIKRHNT